MCESIFLNSVSVFFVNFCKLVLCSKSKGKKNDQGYKTFFIKNAAK